MLDMEFAAEYREIITGMEFDLPMATAFGLSYCG